MSATKRPGFGHPRRLVSQRGVTSVEVALLAVIFFTFVFGLIEVARLLFVYNTLHEVTRRAAVAAATVYPRDSLAMGRIRPHAIFRDAPGDLMLAPPVTDGHVRLDYLNSTLAVIPQGSWPSDAATNKQVCMVNPRAANCIRFVQARICDPETADECSVVRSQMMLPFIDLGVPLHRATTIATVESLGYVPGTPPPDPPPVCPCP